MIDRRKPLGLEIATASGKRIAGRFDHRPRGIGVEVRAVTFADHRSGWSGLQVCVRAWGWEWRCYPLVWRTPPSDGVRVLTLREQVERDHGKRLEWVPKTDD